MGDPQTLIDFVQWAKAAYPADHYALVFWDHGLGWRPDQTMWDETDQDALDPDEIAVAMIGIFWPRLAADLDEPSSPQNDFEYYRNELAFSQWTHWDEFLNAYAAH